ncbi:glycoside hydrolase family 16 protein [Moelleriella libera RCEF 2490]|uniref:Glycoside hydrolase family 16 protein n=1 Tax=Moelleriella libera RCEF 2490 TaxID=1081109 RepID=A0A166U7F0_9HYPO|nr:glycoside hydrolase family 16 protein [Moelleriella libera RCEF 2490]
MAYALATSYAGEALLSGFNWFDGPDPSHGSVSYQSRPNAEAKGLFSVDETTGVVRLGVDSTNKYSLGEGRPSIRLESKAAFNQGLFIADFLHMPPSQCGLWPAFWSYGPNWPYGGEIDIIEGANDQYLNVISAHTATGCRISDDVHSQSTGFMRASNCDVGTDNIGCGYDSPTNDTAAYGDGFNAAKGGVYAMEWDSDFIKVWHFTRGQIPRDISNKKPNPATWGAPEAVFGGSSCKVDDFFKDMNLVININFCGDWGNAIWGKTDGCGKFAPTCPEYVANNPQAFSNAYWDVRYIDAYQRSDSPPSPSSSSSSSIAASSSSSSRPALPSSSPSSSSLLRNQTSAEPTSTTTMTTSITTTVTVNGRKTTKVIGVNSKFVAVPSLSAPAEATSEPKNPLSVGDSALLGCYGSGDGFKTFRQVQTSSKMTLERCVDACQGSMFAGVYDMQCFCADTLDVNTRAVDGSNGVCDHPCPGNRDEYCGGLAKSPLSVANSGNPSIPGPIPPSDGGSAPNDNNSSSPNPGNPSNPGSMPPLNRNSAPNKNNSTLANPPPRLPPTMYRPTGGAPPYTNMTKRFTFQRRAERPKNILLTVYGVVKNEKAPPLPPPMAPGSNVTYTVTDTVVQTVSCTRCTAAAAAAAETVTVAPVQQTGLPHKTETAILSQPESSIAVLPAYSGKIVYETVRPVEIVTETCDTRTSQNAAVSTAPAYVAPASTASILTVPSAVYLIQPALSSSAAASSSPAPSANPSFASPGVVIAGADSLWSETKLHVTLGLALFVIVLLL